MSNYTGPIIIGLIDLVILYGLTKNHFLLRNTDRSVKYNRLKYNLTTLLLIANTFAFMTSIIAYFVLHVAVIDLLIIGRFADRYVMMFAYRELYGEQEEESLLKE
jgi:cation transport ATPase